MPEYLAPGVYVEETSFRSRSIEGVSTSTTGFVGPTRKGPLDDAPELITSFGDFERVYGGFADLERADGSRATNFIAHAVRNYFDNGGARLFVARVYTAAGGGGTAATDFIGGDGDNANNIRFVARTAGAVGNGAITLALDEARASERAADNAPEGSVIVNDDGVFVKRGNDWRAADDSVLGSPPGPNARFVTVNVLARDADRNESFYEGLGLAAGHPKFVGDVLSATPSRRIDALENTFAIDIGDGVDAFRMREILAAADATPLPLTGGNDGLEPASDDFTGPLNHLARIEDISIVAAPGYSSLNNVTRRGVEEALLQHVSARRAYRIAVLDTPPDLTNNGAIDVRSQIDSTYAALYYPWVIVANPLARPDDESIPRELPLPPSGFVCGIYARNDITRGVAKSPGNEVVRGALRFETDISFGEQEQLNPRGVNCLRYFPGRGYRLWGARTASSDPEWKYVGPRRYFIYLEHSIDRSTQWAVFENNGPRLWANIRETVSGFLYNEWVSGSLLGDTQEAAFFVRCDRTTMTQNDLDNGRLICLIGVAVLKPAEFVVFRIGQKTADSSD